MEALLREISGKDFVQVGVVFFDVPLSNDDTSNAQNEVQLIQTTSAVVQEVQVCKWDVNDGDLIGPLMVMWLKWGGANFMHCHGMPWVLSVTTIVNI